MNWIPLLLLLALLPTGLAQAALKVDAGDDDTKQSRTIDVPAPKDGRGGAEIPLDPFGSILVFKNGDRLHGNLVSVQAEQQLVWARPDVGDAIPFGLDNLYGLKMERGRPPSDSQQTLVHLTNGDALQGEILGLDKDHLKLRTWYGGDLNVKRYMIAAIHPPSESEATLLYDGPTDMAEWTSLNGEWQVRRGELIGYGRVGANIQLPDMARLRFEVNWPGRYSNFSVATYVNDLKNFYHDSYHMTFSSNHVALHRRTRNQGTLNLGQVQVPYLMSRSKAWFEILVNKEASTFALLVNDQLIKEWNDPQGFAGAGTGIVFNCHDRNAPIGFSDISVSEWDGKLGSIGAVEADDQDVIQFANFDRITGKINAIGDNTVTFQTPYAVMEVPLTRIQTLALAQTQAQRARRYNHDIQLYFADGERITVRLNSIKDGTFTGYTENIGDVKLDMDAFYGMRLNIYDEDLPAEDETDLFDEGNFQDYVTDW